MDGPSFLHQLPLAANANVRPYRFITGVAGTNGRAVEAPDGTTPTLGATFGNRRYPPGSAADDGFHAIAGEAVQYAGPMQSGQVLLGTAVTSLVVPLVAYTDGTVGAGAAKPCSFAGGQTTLIWIAALPQRLGSIGDVIPIFMLSPFCVHPALS